MTETEEKPIRYQIWEIGSHKPIKTDDEDPRDLEFDNRAAVEEHFESLTKAVQKKHTIVELR